MRFIIMISTALEYNVCNIYLYKQGTSIYLSISLPFYKSV